MVGYKIIFDMADKNNRISFLNFPSLEKISEGNHSLKLINTINVIPNPPSLDNLDFPLAPSFE